MQNNKDYREAVAKAKAKMMVPVVYAVLIKTDKGKFLWIEAAYSLENAFEQAKVQLRRLHPHVNFSSAKIELFNHEPIEELYARSEDLVLDEKKEEPKPEPEMDKNQKISKLMKDIIETKDLKLFEDNKSIFTESQVKFLEDKLKNKRVKK